MGCRRGWLLALGLGTALPAAAWEPLTDPAELLPLIDDIRLNGADVIVNGQWVVLDGDLDEVVPIDQYWRPIVDGEPWPGCQLGRERAEQLRRERGLALVGCNAQHAWLVRTEELRNEPPADFRGSGNPVARLALFRWRAADDSLTRLPEPLWTEAGYAAYGDSGVGPWQFVSCVEELDGRLAVHGVWPGHFYIEWTDWWLDAESGAVLAKSTIGTAPSSLGGEMMAWQADKGLLWSASGTRLCRTEAAPGKSAVGHRCADVAPVLEAGELQTRLSTEAADRSLLWLAWHLQNYRISDVRGYTAAWLASVDIEAESHYVTNEVGERMIRLPVTTAELEPFYQQAAAAPGGTIPGADRRAEPASWPPAGTPYRCLPLPR